jgi:hypothetical protein
MKTLGFFLMTVFLTCKAHGAFSYQVTEGPADLEFKSKAQIMLKQAESLLPYSVKANLKSPLEVRFASISARKDALGVYAQGRLTLDLKTVSEIRNGEANATPTRRTHKTLYREILATVLHETMHAYDYLNLHDSAEKQWINACRDQARNRKDNQPSAECEFYKNMNKSFSQNPYFSLAAGFVYDDVSWFNQRSPDVYELTSSSESLAVNMEYFLLDPEYACRRPTLYKILQSKFQHTPFKVNCQAPFNYLVSDFATNTNPLKTIDPARVYQIHYLIAGEGDGAASGFGHSMFRIVMCAPDRRNVGPECLKDLEHHLVLSFRAFVDSPQINNLKGLKGDYPSRLFIIPFNQTLEEYNRTELRDLRSIPMKLSREEIEKFLTRSVETHWFYDGKYYFASNNCAVESLNLLRTALPRPEFLKVDTITPTGLERALGYMNMLETRNYRSRTEAINEGYLFESYADRYALAYQVLRTNLQTSSKDFQSFLDLPAATRRLAYNKLTSLPQDMRLKTAAAILILEKASQRMVIAKMKEELSEKLLKDGSLSRAKAEKIAKLDGLFSQPAVFISGSAGYGLPTSEDTKIIQARSLQAQKQGSEMYAELTKQGRIALSPQHLKNLESSRDSIQFATGFLRETF